MDFTRSLPQLVTRFGQANIRYALIGGLAMALHGLQRATLDADFVLMLDDLSIADGILVEEGYERGFHSPNVSHFTATFPLPARVDILHAFRPATLGMLDRAKCLPLTPELNIPVVSLEDIIGLKIQASVNDPSRYYTDWSDIHAILAHCRTHTLPVDWDLLADYLALFDLQSKLPDLLRSHGSSL